MTFRSAPLMEYTTAFSWASFIRSPNVVNISVGLADNQLCLLDGVIGFAGRMSITPRDLFIVTAIAIGIFIIISRIEQVSAQQLQHYHLIKVLEHALGFI